MSTFLLFSVFCAIRSLPQWGYRRAYCCAWICSPSYFVHPWMKWPTVYCIQVETPQTCPNSPRESSRSSKDGYMPTVPFPPYDLCPFSCAQSKVLLCFCVTVVVFNQLWSVLLFSFYLTSTSFYLLDRKRKNMYVRSSHTVRFTNAILTAVGALSDTLRVYTFIFGVWFCSAYQECVLVSYPWKNEMVEICFIRPNTILTPTLKVRLFLTQKGL